jgi:hypothetical protein
MNPIEEEHRSETCAASLFRSEHLDKAMIVLSLRARIRRIKAGTPGSRLQGKE